jgi:hypothetical protein
MIAHGCAWLHPNIDRTSIMHKPSAHTFLSSLFLTLVLLGSHSVFASGTDNTDKKLKGNIGGVLNSSVFTLEARVVRVVGNTVFKDGSSDDIGAITSRSRAGI